MLFTNHLGTDLLAISLAFLVILVGYFKLCVYKYWARRGVATPKPTKPFGHIGSLLLGLQHAGELFRDFYNQFKRQDLRYGGAFFGKQFFMPIDPELVKCILQKDFDHFTNHGNYVNEEADPLSGNLFMLEDVKWKNLRAKLTPTFTSGKMKMMFETLADCAVNLKDVLQKYSDEQTPVEIKEMLTCYATDVIGSCAFGIECNSLKNPNNEFRRHGKMISEISLTDYLKQMCAGMFPRKLLLRLNFVVNNPKITSFFLDLVKRTVEYREKNNIYRKDFMHLLIQLKNMGTVTDDEKLTDNKFSEVGLTVNEMAANAFVFFSGGSETSSITTTFALYEISLNQEIQRKMREELNRVQSKYDNKLTYDGIMELHYMDKVINETLRKYPPVPGIGRICNKDYKVPNSDLIIEKDTMVLISILGIHRDHEYYPNPEVFDPERFNEENKSSRPSYTWLPFGEGQRICIGLRFAIMQTKVALAALLHNYAITINRKSKVPLVFDKNNLLLSPEGGMWLNIKEIKK